MKKLNFWPFCKRKVKKEIHIMVISEVRYDRLSEKLAICIDKYASNYNAYLAGTNSFETLKSNSSCILKDASNELDGKDFSLFKEWTKELYDINELSKKNGRRD